MPFVALLLLFTVEKVNIGEVLLQQTGLKVAFVPVWM